MRNAIRNALGSAGMTGVFSVAPDFRTCAEPIVVVQGEYEKDEDVTYGERGHIDCRVLACRDTADAAMEAARAVEATLEDWDWSYVVGADYMNVVGVHTDAAKPAGRDTSLRFVAQVDVRMEVLRDVR